MMIGSENEGFRQFVADDHRFSFFLRFRKIAFCDLGNRRRIGIENADDIRNFDILLFPA